MSEITSVNAFDVYEQELRPAGILIDTREATLIVMRGNVCIGRFIKFEDAVRAATLFLRNANNA